MSPWLIGIFGFVVALMVAHTVAYRIANFRTCEIGRGRDVMPTIAREEPDDTHRPDGWINRVRGVEKKLLDHFQGDVLEARASVLARDLGVMPILVDAALERMREEIPCRLRVTRDGELLHDFAAEHLDELRQRRRRSLPFRILLVTLSTLANISAIWPVLMIFFIGIAALDFVFSAEIAAALVFGLLGFVIVSAILLSAFAGSYVIRLFLTPLLPSPPLDYAQTPKRASNTMWWGKRILSGYLTALGIKYHRTGIRYSSRTSTNRGQAGGALGLVKVFMGIFLFIMVFASLFTIFVWGRGVYRAVTEGPDETEKFGPSSWTQLPDEADWYERFLPTNDLVSRMLRSIRRVLKRRRPGDLQLVGRMVELARTHGGRLTGLDIALAEALDPAEVAEVGAEMTRRFDGEIRIADNGELIFELDEDEVDDATVPTGPVYEYVERPGPNPGELRRRITHPGMKLPVNMVGLKYVHIRAADFLVGGAMMMFATSLYVFQGLDPMGFELGILSLSQAAANQLWAFGPLISLVAFLFAVGTTSLATTARYLAKSQAIEGVQRDARRVYAHAIRDAVEAGDETFDPSPWVDQMKMAFEMVHETFDRDFFQDECIGILVDFDLDDQIEFDGRHRLMPIDLEPLRQRLTGARSGPSEDLQGFPELDDTVTDQDSDETADDEGDDDEVVFETETSPDRIRALG